jgi:hypothetical protein
MLVSAAHQLTELDTKGHCQSICNFNAHTDFVQFD